MGVGSLSWDQVLHNYIKGDSGAHQKTVHHIREAYQKTHLMIRLAPGIPMVAFPEIVDVGPIVGPALKPTGELREYLNVKPDEKLVLVGFGGIPLRSLPIDNLEQMDGYRFLIGSPMRFDGYTRVSSTDTLPIPFRHILAEADIVVTKTRICNSDGGCEVWDTDRIRQEEQLR